MAKLTLADVGNLVETTTAATTINSNSAAIEAAVENTLSRDGSSPNQMQAALDMNSNRIVNLPAPITLLEPVRLTDLDNVLSGGTITVQPLPSGGTTGQILEKLTNSNYDVFWADPDEGIVATTVAELKAFKTSISIASLTALGREGRFIWKTGDYSTAISTDTNNGIYIKSNDFPTTEGSWVRDFDFQNYNSRWFGTINDHATDNSTIINTIIQVANVPNTTFTTPGRQSAAYINIEGGVRFSSTSLSFLPTNSWIYIYLKYFANSDYSKGVPSGGGATNEQHILSVNSGFPGDISGAMVAEYSFDAPFHPAFILNISKQQSGADAHFATTQHRIPDTNNDNRASYNIFDENVIRWRTIYNAFGGSVFSGVWSQPFGATVSLANVGSTNWPTIPANGVIFWGVLSGARAVKTGHNTSAIQGDWITGVFQDGEQVTDGVTTSTLGISGGGATFTNNTFTPMVLGISTPTWSYGVAPGNLVTGAGIGGRLALMPTNNGLQQTQKETVTNPGFLFTTDTSTPTTGTQLVIDSNKRLITVDGIALSTTAKGNAGGLTSHGTATNSGLGSGTFNMTSFVNLGTGSYRLTFPTKASTNYAISVMSDNPLDQITYSNKTTTTVDFAVINITSRAVRNIAGEISITITGGDT